ncbi:tail protein X [Paracoccus denitrificans]|jgi:phage tail protein X|uniref:tail protein X n=1 Tax=Paracoccus denitrificans TaxID=266 RepID=UPI003364D70E
MATYITAGGEMIDQIAWRYYGHQIGTTEAVLAANPGLAARAQPLPSGLTIELPVIAARSETTRPVRPCPR